MTSPVYALVAAAGRGRRFGAPEPKQYQRIAGKTLLYFAVRALARHPRIAQLFVVLAPDDGSFRRFDWGEFGARLEPLYCGGASRAASVYNGLLAARDAIGGSDWVVVHDAARPCLGHEELERLFAEVGEDDAGGLLALPVADTLKRGDAEGRVVATEPRNGLWVAQTPQMFRYGVLLEALRAGDLARLTDEARAVEALGLKPRLVLGSALNLKVTYPEDLALAELILRSREGASVKKARAGRAEGERTRPERETGKNRNRGSKSA